MVKKLIDKFYDCDDEEKNVQVSENSNSSDKENDGEVSSFISHEDSCGKCLP